MRTGENIFKRKDGRWEARFRKGRDASGKIIYGYCYGRTYSEAKERAEKAKNQPEKPQKDDRTKAAFSHYCNAWLQQNRLRMRDSTYIKYQGFLCNHIIPYFGDKAPSDIDTMMVTAFTEYLLGEKNLSVKTTKDILIVLNTVLRYTSRQLPGQLRNIDVIYPSKEPEEIRVLSVKEQEVLTNYLLQDMDRRKLGILLTLMTGIRVGELCALQWDHIMLAQKLMRIDSSMQRMKNLDADVASAANAANATNGANAAYAANANANAANACAKTVIVMGPPKSRSSIRTIPLPDTLVSLCRPFRPENGAGYFLTGTNRLIEPRTMQRAFGRYARDCGLENVTVHTCRHTFATRCIEAGFEMKSLSEIMGHANVSITMNRYVHCSMELKQKNMEKVSWPGIG